MNKNIFSILFIIFVTSISCYAESTSRIFILQNEIPIRSSGLAGSFTAISNDASAIAYNPAGIAQIKVGSVSFGEKNISPKFGVKSKFNYKYLFASLKIDKIKGNIGFELSEFKDGVFACTDNKGNYIGDITFIENLFSLSYASKINSYLSFGASIKFLNLNFKGRINPLESSGTIFDFGLLYNNFMPNLCYNKSYFKFKYQKYISNHTFSGPAIGISIRNIGSDIKYLTHEQKEPMPQQLRLGFAWRILNTDILGLNVSSDIRNWLINNENKQNNILEHFNYSFGSEISFFSILMFRIGKYVGYDDYYTQDYISYGLSVGFETIKFNASYIEPDISSLYKPQWNYGFSIVY